MKNKIYALMIHLINIVATTTLMFATDLIFTGKPLLPIRILIALIPLFIYYKFTIRLRIYRNNRRDIGTGVIITIIAILLCFFVVLKSGTVLPDNKLGSYNGRLYLDIFLSPVLFPFTLMGYRYKYGTMLCSCFLPQIIIFLSIKNRRKHKKMSENIFK